MADDNLRIDGSRKGPGWLGTLDRPDGHISTEISVGVSFDGKDYLIPSLVPTLDQEEINWLLEGNEATPAILDKAIQHALPLVREGLSPFKE